MPFNRGRDQGEVPSVAAVEEILQDAASRAEGQAPHRNGRLVVTHAVWLCACETLDESPCWLIYSIGEDGIGWERMPDGTDVPDVVEAEHLTGGHPSPEAVLEWLRGNGIDPWRSRGDLPEDTYVFEELKRRVRSS